MQQMVPGAGVVDPLTDGAPAARLRTILPTDRTSCVVDRSRTTANCRQSARVRSSFSATRNRKLVRFAPI